MRIGFEHFGGMRTLSAAVFSLGLSSAVAYDLGNPDSQTIPDFTYSHPTNIEWSPTEPPKLIIAPEPLPLMMLMIGAALGWRRGLSR